MTRKTNARIAGFTFLFYIAVGITSMVLSGRATGGEGTAAKLASIAQHATYIRITVILTLFAGFSALVLAEGITGVFVAGTLGLLWLATTSGANAPDTAAAQTLAAFLLRMDAWSPAAILFAVGSTLFSWLLLRGRMIPVAMAWLGVFASVLLVVILPLQLVGLAGPPITTFMWLPALVFELGLAMWLLIKGAAFPAARQSA